MKEYIFFPVWKIDKLETILKEKELSGWKLYKVTSSSCFWFVSSPPKDVEYILTFEMAKDTQKGMFEHEQILLSECNAQQILTINCDYKVFRITGDKRDLSDIKKYRAKYLKHILSIYLKIIISLLFSVFILLAFVSLRYPSIIWQIFLVIYFLFSITIVSYFIYGYNVQKNK